MVAALIMGAAIRPRPVFVKVVTVIPGSLASRAPRNDNDYQIVGFHGVGTTR
jgi:hypothetical protein